MQEATVILEARHLVKSYKQRTGNFGFEQTTIKALDDVSIRLKKALHWLLLVNLEVASLL